MSNYNVIVPHYSVMLADGLKSIIQDQYQFKNKISMELLSAKMNDIYRVYSGENTYYLRIPRHERFWPYTLINYQFEMQLVNHIRQQDLSISFPIPTVDRNFLGVLNAPEGIRYYSLHTEAKGSIPDMKNKNHLKAMGRYLAKLHLVTENYTSSKEPMVWDFDLLIDYGMNKLRKYLPEDLRGSFLDVSQKTTELIKEFRSIMSTSETNWGVIHGNFVPKNLRIEDKSLMLFDFEYCGMGWRIFDFAFIIHKTNLLNLKNKQFQTLLDAYMSIKPLSDAELDSLQIIAKLALVSRMTRTSGMRDLVGVLWFDEQVRNDLRVVKNLL